MGCTQSTPVEETTTSAPPPSEPLPAPAEAAPASTEPAVEKTEPEAETKEPEAEAEEPAKKLFNVNGYTIEEDGVVYYTVEPVEAERSFKKRYSDFKALVAALGSPKSLPSLPDGGLLSKVRGKHSPALLKEREVQLAVVLNAIANDEDLAQTDAFKEFVA